MRQSEFHEVMACLPAGKTCFHYHRDRYVLYLLQRLQHGSGLRTIRDVKQSRYAHWLLKPFIRQWLAQVGRDDLPLAELLHHWPTAGVDSRTYLLSLDRWGDELWDPWFQTSRPGVNAVLQLNLPWGQQQAFDGNPYCEVWRVRRPHHPLSRQRLTLAWARLDWDLASGQAMVEEIQSDWLRDYPHVREQAEAAQRAGAERFWYAGYVLDVQPVLDHQQELEIHRKLWSEAMLTAALQFLQQEMGLREVFYHSWQTGNAIKRLDADSVPPRSLYSELPQRFGFEQVNRGPQFLECDPKVKKVKKRQSDWQWYRWAA